MFLSPSDLVKRLPIKKGDTVADFGCGSGAYLSALSNIVGSSGKVYAFDIKKDILDRLSREAEKFGYDNIEFAIQNIERKTYCEAYSLDAVVLSNVLFQVDNINNVIKEVKRILKPNSFVLIVEWKSNLNHFGPLPDHIIQEEKVLAILAKNNFTIKRHLPAGNFHYAIIAEN